MALNLCSPGGRDKTLPGGLGEDVEGFGCTQRRGTELEVPPAGLRALGLSIWEKRRLRGDLLALCSFPGRIWRCGRHGRGGAELKLGIRRDFLAKKGVKPWKGFLERGFCTMP